MRLRQRWSRRPKLPRYGSASMVFPRLGQGSFRVLVTDAYGRQCAATGERTLPVLQAAHIHPYAVGGPHRVDNGLLLRSDLHTLSRPWLSHRDARRSPRGELAPSERNSRTGATTMHCTARRSVYRPARTCVRRQRFLGGITRMSFSADEDRRCPPASTITSSPAASPSWRDNFLLKKWSGRVSRTPRLHSG